MMPRWSVFLLVVGGIPALLSLVRSAALDVVGVTTVGTASAVEPTGGDDHEYGVSHAFVAKGSTVSGSAVLGGVLEISTLPASGRR